MIHTVALAGASFNSVVQDRWRKRIRGKMRRASISAAWHAIGPDAEVIIRCYDDCNRQSLRINIKPGDAIQFASQLKRMAEEALARELGKHGRGDATSSAT